MPEPVWLAHPDGRITYVSPKGLELVGRGAAEVYENGWIDVLHPEDREAVIAAVERTLRTGEPYDKAARVRAADGSYRWIRSSASALRRDGAIVAFVGTLVDVDTYRASEGRLRHLIDSDLVGFARVEMNGTIIESNRAFATMLGYEPDQIPGKKVADITPSEWRDEDARHRELLLHGGAHLPFRKEYVRADGSRVPVLVFGAREPDNDNIVSAYAVDLSAEQQYQSALAEAQHFNDTLLDSMPIIFWAADEVGNPLYFNRWFYDYTGLEEREGEVPDAWDVIYPDDHYLSFAATRSLRRKAEPFDTAIRYRRASDGSYRWHHVHSTPIKNTAGDVVGWLGFCLDVHDQRRATERQRFLLRATAALSPLLEPQDLFERLVRECVPEMGDSAQLLLLDGAKLVLTALSSTDPLREKLIWDYYKSEPDLGLLYDALGATEPILYRSFSKTAKEMLQSHPQGDEFETLQPVSAIVTPLRNERGVFGLLINAYGPSDRRYDEEDAKTLGAFGQRVALVIESAQRFAREHRVAEALQRASLPRSLPTPVGVTLHPYYAAAPSEAQIGGDWYDAVELNDGRVMLSIGDVTGHGLEAAVTMGNIRQIFRGIAHVHPDPGLMLDAANRALRSEHPETYATAFVCVLDPIESSLAYASAGHPPALLRRKGGDVLSLEASGLPLGMHDSVEATSAVADICEGDTLVLYTDGLTEARRKPLEGEEQLCAAVRSGEVLRAANPAREICDRLVGGSLRDDIAVLVASIGSFEPVEGRMRRWHANANDAPRTNELTNDLLAVIAAITSDEDVLFRARLILGELTGNVVRHTPGPMEIVLEQSRKSVILHVLDKGDGFEFVPRLPQDTYAERGRGLFITASFADDFAISRRAAGGSHARAILNI